MNDYTPKDIARFWSKVNRTDNPDQCWEWNGCINKDGYGKIGIGGENRYTHRIAWEISNNKIPNGLKVLHACDNPPCCNPNHLFLGTQVDNIEDMKQKGRNKFFSGQEHPNSKLTENDVIEIRQSRKLPKKIKIKDLALKYNVSKSLIDKIISGVAWKHLDL